MSSSHVEVRFSSIVEVNGPSRHIHYKVVTWWKWPESYLGNYSTQNTVTTDSVVQHRRTSLSTFRTDSTECESFFFRSDSSVDNMRFLNIEQALADLAHFIAHIRQRHPEFEDSAVVMVGGSYSATLVAWFLQKYPHLAAGAWSSSAPMFVKPDFFEYKEVVGAAVRSVGGEVCYRRLEGAFRQADQLFANGNFAEFSERFRTCDEMNDEDPFDIQIFFYVLSELLAGLVQYHRSHSLTSCP